MRVSSLIVSFTALLAGPGLSQTFIVDDGGGPSVHCTDIRQAIAVVPSGSVLRVI